jgi:hypothetical protein
LRRFQRAEHDALAFGIQREINNRLAQERLALRKGA